MSEWIKVWERKPEPHEAVLFVYTAHMSSGASYIHHGFMNESGDWFDSDDDDEEDAFVRRHVSHWMPLPNLPEGYEPPNWEQHEASQ